MPKPLIVFIIVMLLTIPLNFLTPGQVPIFSVLWMLAFFLWTITWDARKRWPGVGWARRAGLMLDGAGQKQADADAVAKR